jgi:hypothetical protein
MRGSNSACTGRFSGLTRGVIVGCTVEESGGFYMSSAMSSDTGSIVCVFVGVVTMFVQNERPKLDVVRTIQCPTGGVVWRVYRRGVYDVYMSSAMSSDTSSIVCVFVGVVTMFVQNERLKLDVVRTIQCRKVRVVRRVCTSVESRGSICRQPLRRRSISIGRCWYELRQWLCKMRGSNSACV